MHVTFYGAVREVTGSMHLVASEDDRIVLDCGLFQGRRQETAEKNRIIPFDPSLLTTIVLSHAHIDHSGRLPLLVKGGFAGRIIATRATASASEYLLKDSAHIQESDANYLNYKTARQALRQDYSSSQRGKSRDEQEESIRRRLKKDGHGLNFQAIDGVIKEHRLERIKPLYSMDDAEDTLEQIDGYPYRQPIIIGKNMTCTFYDAGHILGSAFVVIRTKEQGRTITICFTGDIGRFNKPIIKDPSLQFAEEDREIDLLIMESTYGDRVHEPVDDLKPELKKVIIDTVKRGGSIIIPAFAFGRTQELVYMLHELYEEGDIPQLPIYINSPLATKLTKVFGEHPEVYDQETHDTFLKKGINPFVMKHLHLVETLDDSIALTRETKPHIVLSASGMCEAGRILHHLRYKIHDAKNTIAIVGYQAEHTLGRRIVELGRDYEASGRTGTPPTVKILGKDYPLKARVVELGGFSAHADKNEMLHFVKDSNLNIKKIALVHGEEKQILSFAEFLRGTSFNVTVPKRGETVVV